MPATRSVNLQVAWPRNAERPGDARTVEERPARDCGLRYLERARNDDAGKQSESSLTMIGEVRPCSSDPGEDKTARLPNMPPNGYLRMVCVEAAAVRAVIVLPPKAMEGAFNHSSHPSTELSINEREQKSSAATTDGASTDRGATQLRCNVAI